jgi:hypothetical protein
MDGRAFGRWVISRTAQGDRLNRDDHEERYMSARVTSSRTLWGLIAALALYCASVRAAEPPAAPPEPSKEMGAKMASARERMAACLRSDKPMAEVSTQAGRQLREPTRIRCRRRAGLQDGAGLPWGYLLIPMLRPSWQCRALLEAARTHLERLATAPRNGAGDSRG